MVNLLFQGPVTFLQVAGWLTLLLVLVIVVCTLYTTIKYKSAEILALLLFAVLIGILPTACFQTLYYNRTTYNDISSLYNNLNEKIIVIQDYNVAIDAVKSNTIIEECNKLVNSYNSCRKDYIDGVNSYTYIDGQEVFASYPKIIYNYEQNTFTFEDGSEIKTSTWKGV